MKSFVFVVVVVVVVVLHKEADPASARDSRVRRICEHARKSPIVRRRGTRVVNIHACLLLVNRSVRF